MSLAPLDPIAASQSILSILAKHSPASDRDRSVQPEAMAAIRRAGLSRLLTPAGHGGYEQPASDFIRSCRTLAHGCAAASWVHMVCGAHTYVAARFPAQCQDEIFADDPDVLIPGTLAPQGRVREVEGGWRLSGRWQFGSGVDHGPWLLLGALAAPGDDGQDPSVPAVHVLVPKADVTVDDTWFVLGMRGSGSKDLVAEDVFVPAHRAMPTRELFRGDFEGEAGALYRLPVMGGLASMLAATVVGMTEAGLSTFLDATSARREVYSGAEKATKPGVQMRIAEARGEVELAEMLVEKNCTLLDQAMAENNPPLSTGAAAQIRWNAGYAVELCRRATERVYSIAGANATRDSSPLQRWYRDVNTACHHAICDFDGLLEMRGRLALGMSAGTLV